MHIILHAINLDLPSFGIIVNRKRRPPVPVARLPDTACVDEIAIAVEAVRSVGADLPVFASMAFENKGGEFKTMMGVDVAAAVARIIPLGVDAVGFNCGDLSLDDYIALADEYVSEVKKLKQDVTILAEPNAGQPELVDGKPVYKVTPDDFASALQKIHSKGVSIIGGCCGTGPEHIEAVAKSRKKQ